MSEKVSYGYICIQRGRSLSCLSIISYVLLFLMERHVVVYQSAWIKKLADLANSAGLPFSFGQTVLGIMLYRAHNVLKWNISFGRCSSTISLTPFHRHTHCDKIKLILLIGILHVMSNNLMNVNNYWMTALKLQVSSKQWCYFFLDG